MRDKLTRLQLEDELAIRRCHRYIRKSVDRDKLLTGERLKGGRRKVQMASDLVAGHAV